MFTGKDIRRKRKELGLSAEKLALLLEVSADNLYKWEKGTRPNNARDYLKLEKWLNGGLESVLKKAEPENDPVDDKPVDSGTMIVSLMKQQNQLIEMQNRILSDMKDGVQSKVDRIDKKVIDIDTNLNSVSQTVTATWAKASAAIDVSLKSLARLEKRPELSLIDEKDKELEKTFLKAVPVDTASGKHK